jgi:4-hydroxybenzoate polyprenyltransferase
MNSPRSKSTLWALLTMARPANIVTAHADIFAGYAAASAADPKHLVSLLIAATGLYGGGIVWNDVCDARRDAIERPERPIPRGVVSRNGAACFGAILLIGGVAAAWSASREGGLFALATASAALLYNFAGKHNAMLGPLNMGLCRGLNFLVGLSASAGFLMHRWPTALIALFYIAGVTALSRNEVRGGDRTACLISSAWLTAAAVVVVGLFTVGPSSAYWGLPFFALLLYRVSPAFARAMHTLRAQDVRLAVKAGVLSLIILDSGIAASFAGPAYGVFLLLLYLPAALLAKWFAVT